MTAENVDLEEWGTNNSYLSKLRDQSSQRFQRLLLKENKHERENEETHRGLQLESAYAKRNRGKKIVFNVLFLYSPMC